MTVKKILTWIICFAAAIPLSFAIHEAGHALVAVFCGAPITDFNLTSVDWGDGDFTSFRLAVLYAAGTGLALITALMCFAVREKHGLLNHMAVAYIISA